MSELLIPVGMPFLILVLCIGFGSLMEKCAMGQKPTKPVVEDSLVAEAYQECDRKANDLHRRQLRGIVDGFAARIAECRLANMQEAERQERRRLSDFIQRERMGS